MRYFSLLTLLMLSAMFATGCTSLGGDWNKHMPWGENEPQKTESRYQTPVRIVAIWSPAIYNRPGVTPTRGFGGRLYFYNADNEAIPVDGDLLVCAYNDSLPQSSSKAPDRRFAFTAEQFKRHFGETELGASYSIWIPWDEVGKPRVEIGIVPIFTSEKGTRVAGQQSRNFLPGPEDPQAQMKIETVNNTPVILRNDRVPVAYSPQANQDQSNIYGVQQVAYQQDSRVAEPVSPQAHLSGATTASAATLQTMSIDLPGSLADRLARATPQTPIVRQMSAPAGLQQPARIQNNLVEPVAVIGQSPYPSAAESAQHALRNSAMSTEAREWMDRVPRPWTPPDPRLARYARPRSPAPSGPNQSPTAGPLLSPPYPAGQPSPLPGSPQFGPSPLEPATW